MQRDPRAEPQYGERVPYVVVSSGPNARLTDQVVRPQLLLTRPELRIDSRYYIDKQIVPALDRVLSLVGVDVRVWVNEMPRRLRSSICDAVLDVPSDSDGEVGDSRDHLLASGPPSMSGYHGWQNAKRTEATAGRSRAAPRTLKHFYSRRDCFLCGKAIAHAPSSPGPAKPAESGSARACDACAADRPAMLASVGSIQKQTSQALKNVLDQCAACVGGPRADALLAAQACECLDCPTMFQRSALSRRYAAWTRAAQALE
ncbi:DNA polymerase zeta [Coemansia sp. RSA 2320]|nr:DNA polymerase zeta [Coemansia sp. RSA 2320]